MIFVSKGQLILPFAIFLIAAIFLGDNCLADDTKDHPLIKRYPGSGLHKSLVRDFEEVKMPTGKSGRKSFANTVTVKGKATGIIYRNPKKRSTLEIYQNYEEAMQAAGFEFLYTCADKDCGVPGAKDSLLNYKWACFEQRHVTGKLARPEGDIYVNLHVCKGTDKTFLGIVEEKGNGNRTG